MDDILNDTIGQPWLGKPQTDETFLFSVSRRTTKHIRAIAAQQIKKRSNLSSFPKTKLAY